MERADLLPYSSGVVYDGFLMKPTIERHRHLFTGDDSLTVSYRGPLSPSLLIEVSDLVLTRLLPTLGSIEGSLTDTQGLLPERPLALPPASPSLAPRGQELCFIGGVIATGDAPTAVTLDDFWASVTSSFERFDSPHIIHTLSYSRAPSLPATVPFAALGRAFPIRVTLLRFGFEGFRSRRVTSMLGAAPTIDESFAIEADESQIVLQIKGERVPRANISPLRNTALWNEVQQHLLPLIGADT